MPASPLIQAIERRTGETYESLCSTAIDERRQRVEAEFGKPAEFPSYFPYIGRGNVLHDRTTSGEEVNQSVLKALGEKRHWWSLFCWSHKK